MPITHGELDSAEMSPAPLRLPSDREINKTFSSKSTRMILAPEFLFPLPPSTTAPRSPFPPPYSSLAPSTPLPKEHTGKTAQAHTTTTKQPILNMRRTQSATDLQKLAQCKPLPLRPCSNAKKKEQGELKKWRQNIFKSAPGKYVTTRDTVEISIFRDGPKVNKVDSDIEHTPEIFPSAQEPRIDNPPGKEGDEVRRQAIEKDRSYPKQQAIREECESKSITSKASSQSEITNSSYKHKLTPDEIIWLHRNYRGEATFLKAWGLHITKDTDRERGLEILQHLMAAEAPKEKEKSRLKHERMKQRDQQVRAQFATPLTVHPREKDGLHAIEEEGYNGEPSQGSPESTWDYGSHGIMLAEKHD
ncbi:hypothetical protein M426DRAFT_20327 [Hypoxylon sp. CI-4A]|nr:hypothetical protein M426DRAFT_20327 [Hypoxylon sp. CI-4A]